MRRIRHHTRNRTTRKSGHGVIPLISWLEQIVSWSDFKNLSSVRATSYPSQISKRIDGSVFHDESRCVPAAEPNTCVVVRAEER